MAILFSNNALTALAANINDSVTTLAVAATTGANFPVANGTSGDYFVITMEDSLGHREFIKVPKRATDTFGSGPFPCTRGYWGSTARAWTAGDSVDIRWSADAIEEYLSNLSGRYLGAFAAAPTVDAFGSAVLSGDIYYDTVLLNIYEYTGAVWTAGISLGANAVVNTPSGHISSTSVQGAINELDAQVANITFKNRLLNGSWRFDQINEGSAYTVSNTVVQGPDGWTGAAAGAGTFTMQRVADPDNASLFALKVACTVADASIASSDAYYVYQAIEGYDVADLKAGTASAAQITVSVDMKFDIAGAYPIAICNSAANRSYVGTVTQLVGGVNESKTLTLTLDTAGTWLYTSGVGLRLFIGLAVGSTLQTAASAWTTGNFIGVSTTMANFMSANTNVGYIKRIQLEKGATATAFSEVSVQADLARVQRYYWKTFQQGTAVAQNSGSTAGAIAYIVKVAGVGILHDASIRYPVPMRAAPATNAYNPSAGNANWRNSSTAADSGGASVSISSADALTFYNTQGVGDAVGNLIAVHLSANARLS